MLCGLGRRPTYCRGEGRGVGPVKPPSCRGKVESDSCRVEIELRATLIELHLLPHTPGMGDGGSEVRGWREEMGWV